MASLRRDILGGDLKYNVVHVPHNEAGVREFLEDYKALRLFSLQYSPEAFGSTYAREIEFKDSVWYERLANPISNTFLATGDVGNLLGVSTINGPLAIGTRDMPPLGMPQNASGGWDTASPLHFRLNAIFTMPEARQKGISKALVKSSIKFVMDEARSRNKEAAFSIIVDTNNIPARALYESVGFFEVMRLGPSENVYGRPVILFEYHPTSAATNMGEA